MLTKLGTSDVDHQGDAFVAREDVMCPARDPDCLGDRQKMHVSVPGGSAIYLHTGGVVRARPSR